MIRCTLLVIVLFASIKCVLSHKTAWQEKANPFDSKTLPDGFIADISDKKVLLFGELHGTEEFPNFFARVVGELAQHKPLIVGLEFPSDTQAKIDQFLKIGDTKILQAMEFFKDPNYHSGRGSVSMVNLLKKLRKINNIEVFCFDVPKAYSGNQRDTQMAMNLWQKMKQAKKDIVVLTGNIHSRLTVGVPWDPKFATMGSELIRLSAGKITLDNSENYNFRIGLGQAWMCLSQGEGAAKCDQYKTGQPSSPYATEVSYDKYIIAEKGLIAGHKNAIFFRKTNASLPFQ